jgi:hypothetical protein
MRKRRYTLKSEKKNVWPCKNSHVILGGRSLPRRRLCFTCGSQHLPRAFAAKRQVDPHFPLHNWLAPGRGRAVRKRRGHLCLFLCYILGTGKTAKSGFRIFYPESERNVPDLIKLPKLSGFRTGFFRI